LCDNKGAIDLLAISGNQQSIISTKHIDIKHHFIQEKIETAEILVKHVSTNMMLADVTKALVKARLKSSAYQQYRALPFYKREF